MKSIKFFKTYDSGSHNGLFPIHFDITIFYHNTRTCMYLVGYSSERLVLHRYTISVLLEFFSLFKFCERFVFVFFFLPSLNTYSYVPFRISCTKR